MSDFWNAQLYDKSHNFVTQLGAGVVELLDPHVGETILDLGCGTGHLTASIAEMGTEVVGLDASAKMLAVARQEYPNMEWIEGDACAFELDRSFDAVFTNATLHWILEPHRVAERVFAHLKTGGRFVGEFGGQGNVQKLHQALAHSAQKLGLPDFEPHNRHYFASIGQWSGVLEEAGFETRMALLFDRPTPLEGFNGARNWLKQFCAFYLDDLLPEDQERVVDEAQQELRSVLENENGWYADYRRLRFVAVKPDSL